MWAHRLDREGKGNSRNLCKSSSGCFTFLRDVENEVFRSGDVGRSVGNVRTKEKVQNSQA